MIQPVFCFLQINFPNRKIPYVLYDIAGGKRTPLRTSFLTPSEASEKNALLRKAKRGLLWYPKIA